MLSTYVFSYSSGMSEIALDAICDASARSNDEQFLSMLKNSATCSALQCGVFDKLFQKEQVRFNLENYLNERIQFYSGDMMGQKRNTLFPKAPMGRILMKAGAKRVSQDAVDEFTDVVTDIAEEISRQAVKIAHHSGRKTVQGGDVRLAAKQS